MALLYLTSDGKVIMNSSNQVYVDNSVSVTPLEAFEEGISYTFANGNTIYIKVVDDYYDNCNIEFSANFDLQLLSAYGDGSGEITQHWGSAYYNYNINKVYIPGGDTLYFKIYDYDLYSANDYPWSGTGEDEAAYIKSHGTHIGTLKLVELDPGNTGPDWREFGLIEA